MVDSANRRLRLRIEFEISDLSKRPQFDFMESNVEFAMDSIDPDVMPGLPRIKVPVDKFLATWVGTADGREFTVRDVIASTAHSAGIHYDENPKKESERVLVELGKELSIGGAPAGIATLKAVSRIVLVGLEPLEHALRGN